MTTCSNENKTSTTVTRSAPSVTAVERPRAGLCAYVIAAGGAVCDRPALAGSSYCARHRRVGAAATQSPAFAALAAAQIAAAATPPEVGLLNPLLEPFDESDDERLAGLDLPAAAVAHDE